VIVLAREDVEVHLNLLKPRLNTWTKGCTWLSKMSTQSLAVIRSFTVSIRTAGYQILQAKNITDLAPCFTVGTRHSGL